MRYHNWFFHLIEKGFVFLQNLFSNHFKSDRLKLMVDPEGFEPSSKQGISELSTKFRTNLVFDSSQAFIQTKLKLRCLYYLR